MEIDWTNCPAVLARPGYLSGRPGLRDDPRVPPETVLDNLDAGESPSEVIENFGLATSIDDILAIYAYAAERRGPRAA